MNLKEKILGKEKRGAFVAGVLLISFSTGYLATTIIGKSSQNKMVDKILINDAKQIAKSLTDKEGKISYKLHRGEELVTTKSSCKDGVMFLLTSKYSKKIVSFDSCKNNNELKVGNIDLITVK